jgi:DNA-binding NarL/FixJ family response regulator
MITVFDNDDNVFNAIKAGADGYLLKETKAEKIYEAINETIAGGAAMSPSIAMKTLKLLKNPIVFGSSSDSELVELSTREIEVLEHLSKGLKNAAIADNLFLSTSTVKKHIENIYRKLQAHNRIEMLQKAKQNKLL